MELCELRSRGRVGMDSGEEERSVTLQVLTAHGLGLCLLRSCAPDSPARPRETSRGLLLGPGWGEGTGMEGA